MNNNRTLIYTACNRRYACFIPLFCAVALMNNKNIDIEICISVNKLTDAQEVALDYLRQQFSNAKIIIRYNMFKELDDRMIEYQGKKIYSNSARFIINPEIHDEYVYISDIDILMFDKDFQEVHLKWMKIHNTKYCNIIRPKGISLSGLHFTYYDAYFPVDFRRYDITKKDEELLMDIVSSKTQIYKEKKTRYVRFTVSICRQVDQNQREHLLIPDGLIKTLIMKPNGKRSESLTCIVRFQNHLMVCL